MTMVNDIFNDVDPDNNYELFMHSNAGRCSYLSLDHYLEKLSSNNSVSIVNYNLRSFNRNFESFFACFDGTKEPSILNLTETRFSSSNVSNIFGYEGHHTIRDRASPSGGISIYVKKKFRSKKIYDLSYSNDTIEVCTVEVSVSNSLTLIMIGIYRPHSDSISNFSDHLNDFLDKPFLRNKKCIILGDLNICLLKQNQNIFEFSNLLFTHHYLPIITKPTRFSPVSGEAPSLLDHIWINTFFNYECGIVELDITDHLPTFLNFSFEDVHLPEKIEIKFRLVNLHSKNLI